MHMKLVSLFVCIIVVLGSLVECSSKHHQTAMGKSRNVASVQASLSCDFSVAILSSSYICKISSDDQIPLKSQDFALYAIQGTVQWAAQDSVAELQFTYTAPSASVALANKNIRDSVKVLLASDGQAIANSPFSFDLTGVPSATKSQISCGSNTEIFANANLGCGIWAVSDASEVIPAEASDFEVYVIDPSGNRVSLAVTASNPAVNLRTVFAAAAYVPTVEDSYITVYAQLKSSGANLKNSPIKFHVIPSKPTTKSVLTCTSTRLNTAIANSAVMCAIDGRDYYGNRNLQSTPSDFKFSSSVSGIRIDVTTIIQNQGAFWISISNPTEWAGDTTISATLARNGQPITGSGVVIKLVTDRIGGNVKSIGYGNELWSTDSTHYMKFLDNGALVLNNAQTGKTLWTTGPLDCTTNCVFKSGDSLRIIGSGSVIYWAFKLPDSALLPVTFNIRTGYFTIESLVNSFVMYASNDPDYLSSTNTNKGGVISLAPGRVLYSKNMQYGMTQTTQGALTLFKVPNAVVGSNQVLWTSTGSGYECTTSCHAVLSSAGNLVLTIGSTQFWQSQTGYVLGLWTLQVTDVGTLVLNDQNGVTVWSSTTEIVYPTSATLACSASLVFTSPSRVDSVPCAITPNFKYFKPSYFQFSASGRGDVKGQCSGFQNSCTFSVGLPSTGAETITVSASMTVPSGVVQITPAQFQYTSNVLMSSLGQSTMVAGNTLYSTDRKYTLSLLTDGNLVFKSESTGETLWTSVTSACGSKCYLKVNDNGCTGVYNQDGVAQWDTKTCGSSLQAPFYLTVDKAGYFTLTSSNGQVLFNSAFQDRIVSGSVRYQLLSNEQLLSQNTRYRLIMQGDHNLVIYDTSVNKPIWASNTDGASDNSAFIVMQGDGNLVIYTTKPLWASNTNAKGVAPYSAILQNNGNFVVSDSTGKTLWSSNSGRLVADKKHEKKHAKKSGARTEHHKVVSTNNSVRKH